jgi:rhomboid protease GluP
MDNRRMCPHCRAFITASDRVCPYCGETIGARAVDRQNAGEMLVGFIPSGRFVTMVIVLVNLALFAGDQFAGTRTLGIAGADVGVLVRNGQWYRLITAGYLHRDFLHIGMNMWVLFDLGAEVEAMYGPARLFVMYTLATVLGFLASGYFHPMNPSLGASAGLFGLIGAMIALGVRNRHAAAKSIRALYIRWAIYGLLFGLLPGVDNTAHLGGLAAGFIAGYLAETPGPVRSTLEQAWRGAAGICLLVTIYCFYVMYLHIGGTRM